MKAPLKIPCVLMRGGTSKGVFLHLKDLPREGKERDSLILALFGSPDPRQIDGLGGATNQTSKLAVVSRSERPDADVDYLFGQVSIGKATIHYHENCGNLSSAVGPFAIEEGLVEPKEPETLVRIFNVNTKKMIHAKVPVREGKVLYEGDYEIAGVPGRGAEIRLTFFQPGGSLTGKLLPTGKSIDKVKLKDGRELEVTILDAGNPIALLRAEDLRLKGKELPEELSRKRDVLGVLEEVRSIACELLGIVADRKEATSLSPSVPKVAFLSSPQSYLDSWGREVREEDIHLTARVMSMQTPHPAYAVTGAIPTAAAARLPGTLAHELAREEPGEGVVLGHPSGRMAVGVSYRKQGGEFRLESATIGRTARRLMEGWAYVPRERIEFA
ncbi:MAG: 2-methylaconitate cis-trans isomerase PrpF family protein [Nitrospinota bacterium]